jgi:hypothetical protein
VLAPAQVKPFVLHDDRFVRHAAVSYFQGCWCQDGDVLPLVLQAYTRHKTAEDLHGLGWCDHFPVTEEGLASVLDGLAQVTDRSAIDYLNDALVRTPVALAAARDAEIRASPHVLPETLERLERRRRLAERPGEELWQELQDFAHRSQEQELVGDIDHAYADDLTETLAHFPVPDTDTICRLLALPELDDSWLEVFLVDLAGHRRLREAVPSLVDKFRIDTDYLLEQASKALAKIGDPEAARLIRDSFVQESWTFRLYTSSLLGDLKHEESEQAILYLLERKTERDIRANLCSSLCHLVSAHAIEVVRRVIQSGYDSMITNLEEDLLPVADMLGVTIPEAPRWREQREQRSRRYARAMAEWERESAAAQEAKAGTSGTAAQVQKGTTPRSATPAGPDDAGAYEWEKPAPFQRGQARVGRNDPCPCGSGKKFKKCCGKR